MIPVKCRVARLTRDMVEEKPRGYWNRETIEKWLSDQGFLVGNEKMFPIAKTFNPVTRSAHFVQANIAERSKLKGQSSKVKAQR